MKIASVLLLLFIVLTPGCTNTGLSKAHQSDSITLTHEDAKKRKSAVGNIAYDLHLDFKSGAKYYSGTNRVTFDYSNKNSGHIAIDANVSVKGVECNGKALALTVQNGQISLPASCLVNGGNTIIFSFEAHFSKTGFGLIKHTDKSGNEYIYSHFSPSHASYAFPVFDQPDLKAKFLLTVKAPRHWAVISTTFPTVKEEGGSDYKIWQFEQTPMLSSYFFPIHAGQYLSKDDSVNGIPLKIYARPQILENLNVDEIFKQTRESMVYFNNLFGFYPFKKYDQVLVPDLISGGMENAAAVTLDENKAIFKKSTMRSAIQFSDIISHEISHMWIGDYVTPYWWSDIWVKEGLAEYLSNTQRSQDIKSFNAWDVFYRDRLEWAYAHDQLHDTHSLKIEIDNPSQVRSYFNGITYSKGAFVFKLLSEEVGEENFNKGLKNYLEKYSWANANSMDLFLEIERAYGRDINYLIDPWVNESGIDTVKFDYDCEKKILYIPQNKIKRLHRANVKFFKLIDKKLSVETFAVRFPEKNGQYPVKIAFCPDFILPNYDKKDYINLAFNDKSVDFFRENYYLFSPDEREIVTSALWKQVEAGELSIHKYLNFLISKLAVAKNQRDKFFILKSMQPASKFIIYIGKKNDNFQILARDVESAIINEYRVSKDEYTKITFGFLLGAAVSSNGLNELMKVVETGRYHDSSITNQLTRLAATRKLKQYGYNIDASGIKLGDSLVGDQFFISLAASSDNIADKQKWINEIFSVDSPYSDEQLKMLEFSLFPVGKKENDNLKRYIYKRLKSVDNYSVSASRLAIAESSIPFECSKKEFKKLLVLKKIMDGKSGVNHKALSEKILLSRNCLNIKSAAY